MLSLWDLLCTVVNRLTQWKTLVWPCKSPDQLKHLIDDVLTQQTCHKLVSGSRRLKIPDQEDILERILSQKQFERVSESVSQCTDTLRPSHLIALIARQRVTAGLLGFFKVRGGLKSKGCACKEIDRVKRETARKMIWCDTRHGLSSIEYEARLGGRVVVALSLMSLLCQMWRDRYGAIQGKLLGLWINVLSVKFLLSWFIRDMCFGIIVHWFWRDVYKDSTNLIIRQIKRRERLDLLPLAKSKRPMGSHKYSINFFSYIFSMRGTETSLYIRGLFPMVV